MPKGYWVSVYRTIADPEKLAAYDKLAAAQEAVAKVIEVDDFAPEALSPIYKKSADVHQFFQELGEQRAAS